MRRLLLGTLIIFFVAMPGLLSNIGYEGTIMHASADSEIILDKVKLEHIKNGHQISIDHKLTDYEDVDGFKLTIDFEIDIANLEYRAHLAKFDEINQMPEKMNLGIDNQISVNVDPRLECYDGLIPYQLYRRTGYSQLTTEDPPNLDLTYSRSQITWDYNTYAACYVTHSKTTWAANPSALGTHWFVDSSSYLSHGATSYFGGAYVYSNIDAYFHNYDFGNDNLITNVEHENMVKGYHNGNIGSSYVFQATGEFHYLLSGSISYYLSTPQIIL